MNESLIIQQLLNDSAFVRKLADSLLISRPLKILDHARQDGGAGLEFAMWGATIAVLLLCLLIFQSSREKRRIQSAIDGQLSILAASQQKANNDLTAAQIRAEYRQAQTEERLWSIVRGNLRDSEPESEKAT